MCLSATDIFWYNFFLNPYLVGLGKFYYTLYIWYLKKKNILEEASYIKACALKSNLLKQVLQDDPLTSYGIQ